MPEMTEQQYYSFINNLPDLPGFDKIKNKLKSQYQEAKRLGLEEKANQRYEDITNFNSDYYKNFKNYLDRLIPEVSPDSLLAPLTAGGFSYGTSQKLATERAEAINTKRGEKISQTVQEFAIGSQGQAGGLLNSLLSNQQFMAELAEKRRQFDESSPNFLDSILNIVGNIGGLGVGNLFSGKGFFGSSDRGGSGLASPGR